MKCVIICKSVHNGNTKKIADSMAEVLNADVRLPTDVEMNACEEYDLIGIGSGIYHSKHHDSLFRLVQQLRPSRQGNRIFIFSTSGMEERKHLNDYTKPLKDMLLAKGFDVVGTFSCRGYDNWGPFKLVGGINKGRPNDEDVANARQFASKLAERLK
ncbi:MAG: flavodoxin family protein [Candidatus Micrarchaeota archaeon]